MRFFVGDKSAIRRGYKGDDFDVEIPRRQSLQKNLVTVQVAIDSPTHTAYRCRRIGEHKGDDFDVEIPRQQSLQKFLVTVQASHRSLCGLHSTHWVHHSKKNAFCALTSLLEISLSNETTQTIPRKES
ncbi:MAG: hypothetical protein IJU23_04995 [Proteobacteria bacterium]|nr:hypothetical protein [Pseudomonadota bacterium]